MSATTFLFAGGGTGGHLFPGLAVAEALRDSIPEARIVFIGSSRALEQPVIVAQGYAHHGLPAESLNTLRRNPVRFLWGNWQALRQARRILADEKPAVVVGLGGFASAPLVLAARRARIPIVLLEQNAVPGRTTRWLSRFAKTVCVTYPQSAAYLHRHAQVLVTGNPVRRTICRLAETNGSAYPDRHCLLILGGSQGATAINDAVVAAVETHTPEFEGWTIVHQTGRHQLEQVREQYRALAVEHVVEPFFDDMTAVYAKATLVVSRAGATTLAELACAGLPTILIPYPHAADNHQWHNARVFADAEAARLVEQQPQTSAFHSEFAAELLGLMCQTETCRRMAGNMRILATTEAATMVAQQILSAAGLPSAALKTGD